MESCARRGKGYDMKKNQERCDGCGKWVNECSLVWLYGTYDKNDKCVCKKCYKLSKEKDHIADVREMVALQLQISGTS